MALKCVHKGCGKEYQDENEDCIYHPGPPEFHEGQKGWKCCKPRVLTFDEFLAIPPCTTGKHSTVDETPIPPPKTINEPPPPVVKPVSSTESRPQAPQSVPTRLPQDPNSARTPAAPVAPESDSDDPASSPSSGSVCKRRGCDVAYNPSETRENEECVYHPGQALFHEGSKGWTCCKRRVLEFDEFMRIVGCKKRSRHCFVGKRNKKQNGEGHLEKVESVRHDFYQTPSLIHASFFLKKIDKQKSKIEFSDSGTELILDLTTSDGKQFTNTVPLYGKISPEKSTFKVLGTKLELSLAKIDGLGWPVLRSDEKLTGEIIQTGRAGRA